MKQDTHASHTSGIHHVLHSIQLKLMFPKDRIHTQSKHGRATDLLSHLPYDTQNSVGLHFEQYRPMVQPLWKSQIRALDITLPWELAIRLPGTCPREMKTYIHTETCTGLVTAALFTTIEREL